MAARFVGESFLNSLLGLLFDELISPVVVNLIQRKKLNRKLVERLETTLYAARAVLNDAEKRQIKEKAVKDWLDSLKDAVYKADDLLDEVSTKAATQKEPEFSYVVGDRLEIGRAPPGDGPIGNKSSYASWTF